MVERFHANGQLVGVWYSKRKTDEGPILWQKMLDLGVDMFCSDTPLEAQAFFNKNSIGSKKTASEADTEEDSLTFELEGGSNN